MKNRSKTRPVLAALLAALALVLPACTTSDGHAGNGDLLPPHASSQSAPFQGPKANTGAVELITGDGAARLALTSAFVTPDTPDPHWQVVDAQGRAHLLQRIDIKDGKSNRSIEVPAWIGSVSKVQIWCAFAETNLGEAVFSPAAMLRTVPAERMAAATGPALSGPFAGPKANTGAVQASRMDGRLVLTLTDAFVVPDTPDPHWQVVDSAGHAHLLQRLTIKDGRQNRSIVVPAYVADVKTVRIWCAFAEVNLGEAQFARPVS